MKVRFALLGICLLAGCGRETAQTPPEVTSTSSAASSTQTPVALSSLEVTSNRYAPGVMHPHEFTRGEEVRVIVGVANASPGTPLKILWYSNAGTVTGTDVQNVTGSEKEVSFKSPDTSSWSKGTYRVELWVGETKLANTAFVLL